MYNLTAYTYIEHCFSNSNQEITKYDATYYLFILITVLIVGTIICATFHDAKKNNEGTINFYLEHSSTTSRYESVLLCFSITRNWYRLTATPKTDLGRDLQFILSLRYLT